ncbi:hypothetical protein EDD18DRAFT_1081474 [Armillaria luteobubalina]|uniref:RNase H type-1 domain-containing protein n=1 Tax=Armillaria luteobubalina TaxID=153913 RepID=A0AA39PPS8_9AGAR|nr:hypothetical protein EDD18DRAFT_1081474 [Armillaria luteobubalina]
MKSPRSDGGKDILDIITRNKAITVTWIKSLLNYGDNHALWTYFADALMAHHAPKCAPESEEFTKMSLFLQLWKTKTQKLPQDLKEIMQVSKKHGVQLEGLAFSRATMGQMLLWLHSEADKKRHLHSNQKESRCLKETHGAQWVQDAEVLAKCLKLPGHRNNKKCRCQRCVIAQGQGCTNPNKCYKRAEILLRALPLKWNPLHEQPEDSEPPVDTSEDNGIQQDHGIERTFNRNLTDAGTLADAFRIFTRGKVCSELPPPRIDWEESDCGGTHDSETPQTIYTDGGCTNNGDKNAIASVGIWFGQNDP